jgi:hypothetical protein
MDAFVAVGTAHSSNTGQHILDVSSAMSVSLPLRNDHRHMLIGDFLPILHTKSLSSKVVNKT